TDGEEQPEDRVSRAATAAKLPLEAATASRQHTTLDDVSSSSEEIREAAGGHRGLAICARCPKHSGQNQTPDRHEPRSRFANTTTTVGSALYISLAQSTLAEAGPTHRPAHSQESESASDPVITSSIQ